MAYIKIKGSGWCHQCGDERPAFFTKLLQHEGTTLVEGSCATCSAVIQRPYVSTLSAPDPAPEEPMDEAAEPAQTKKEEPTFAETIKEKSSSSPHPALLRMLFAACGLFLIDQLFI